EFPMPIQTIHDLFVETLEDVYYAEKHILKFHSSLVKKASAPELRNALENHRKETEGQVERLEKVFKLIGTIPRGKKCKAIEGIIADAKWHMMEIDDERVLDASLIGSARAVEHYEISHYGSLILWAKHLRNDEVVDLLKQNLDEEKHAAAFRAQIGLLIPQGSAKQQAAA